jgi:hypothetical protein
VADGFCDGFVIPHKISGINMFAHMRSKGAMTGEMTHFRYTFWHRFIKGLHTTLLSLPLIKK